MRGAALYRVSLTGFEALGIGLIFFALFGKDIAAQFYFGFEKRNVYGAGFLIVGCVVCFLCIVADRRLKHFLTTLLSPLLASWTVMLLIIAPATSYYFRGSLYISPQAVGFVAAVACYQTSPLLLRRILIATLCIQFALLLYEFHIGFSLTLSKNEALGYDLPAWGWIIDAKANLVRAKGLLDSTHDSTWLFIYSSFVFPTSIILLVATAIAAWLSMARLGIIVAASLVAANKSWAKTIILLVAIAGATFIATPEKMRVGFLFFMEAFDPSSRSNIARVQATKNSIDYLTGRLGLKNKIDKEDQDVKPDDTRDGSERKTDDRSQLAPEIPLDFASVELTDRQRDARAEIGEPPAKTGGVLSYIPRIIFGVSGLAFVSGEVATESSYTLFLIEYGILGLALIAWTVTLVFFEGRRQKSRTNLTFAIMMAVIMTSSSVQSASSFFMFWIAVFHCTPLPKWESGNLFLRLRSGSRAHNGRSGSWHVADRHLKM